MALHPLLRRLAFCFAGISACAGVLVAPAAASAASTAVPADLTQVSLDPTRVSLSGSGYHGHSVFEPNDVNAYTDDSSDAAFAIGRFPVSVPLASVGTPALTPSGCYGTGMFPSMRLEIDFDGDGTIDGTLVGGAAYLPDWWLTADSQQFVKNGAPDTGAGSGSQWHGTLADWSQNFPDAVILQAGYSIGPDGQGNWCIGSLTLGATQYDFTNGVPGNRVLHVKDLDAALANDGSAGHIGFAAQGLRVYTDDASSNAYVSQSIAAPGGSLPLDALGQPALHWQGDGAAPRPLLLVDFGDGTPYTRLTADPGELDNWYVNDSAPQPVKNRAPSCSFSDTCDTTVTNWNGSLAGWADQFSAARVLAIGFMLGPDEKADGDILHLDAGGIDYTFANTPPTAATRRLSAGYRTPAKMDLSTGVTDPDPGDKSKMIYLVSSGHHGTVTLSDSVATYVPDNGFAGVDSFLYFAYDGINPAARALVNVTVRKASSTLQLQYQPRAPTTGQSVAARVAVTSAGRVDGGTVTVRLGGLTRTAKVSGGVAHVRLGKLTAGAHTGRASFSGTSTAASASDTQPIRVSARRS